MITRTFDDPRELTARIRARIGFGPVEAWKTAPAIYDEHALRILGHPVMEDWEAPYMRTLAGIATRNGGDVLEVGFGMGISAGYIQRAAIGRHVIIEANHDVAARARAFAATAQSPVTVLEGMWEEVVDAIPDGSLDGILFDTYPLMEAELHRNHFRFFAPAFRLLRPGGMLTYYSDEIMELPAEHVERLRECGFRSIDGRVVGVKPPAECGYWRSGTIVAPIVRK